MAQNKNDVIDMLSPVQQKWDSIIKNSKYSNCDMTLALQSAYMNNPYVQNDRLKRLNQYPSIFDRDTLSDALKDPRSHEDALRQASWAFNYQVTPLMKMAFNYSELPLYNWYIIPKKTDKSKFSKPEWKKEYQFVHEYIEKLNPKRTFRNIALQTIREGKAFVSIRDQYTKSNVDYVDLQQIPSTYTQITYRTPTGYGISFNMVMFLTAGNSPTQYHPVMQEYWDEMMGCVNKDTGDVTDWSKVPTNVIIEKSNKMFGSTYMYWKELPPDLFYTISFDDTDPSCIPVFAASFLSANDLSSYRALQQQLLQLPLQQVMTGEIPMNENGKSGNFANDTKLSPELILLLGDLFDARIGSQYIKSFFSPMANLKIHTMNNPNLGDVVGEALSNFYSESGLSSLFTVEKKPSIAQVKFFQKVETQFMLKLYDQFEDMINNIFKGLNLKYEYEFKLIGDILSKDDQIADLEKGLAIGNLYLLPQYAAMHDLTILDADTLCDLIDSMGIYDKLKPLQSSFNSQMDGKNGRPENKNPDSDATAKSQDNGTNIAEGRSVEGD